MSKHLEVPNTGMDRVGNLVVVREPDVSDRPLMQRMIDRTLASCPTVPGVAEAREHGMDPLLHPKHFAAKFKNTGSHRIVMFHIFGTLYLYAMGSAATEDPITRVNAYAEFLIDVLMTHRPENVPIANSSRLLRSMDLVSKIGKALKTSKTTLHADGTPINLNDMSGEFLYNTLAMFASFERDSIVMRNTAGRIAASQRGGWECLGFG